MLPFVFSKLIHFQDYIPYFETKHLGIINASPTAMGLLTNLGPPEWHPASQQLKVDINMNMKRSLAPLKVFKINDNDSIQELCAEAGRFCAAEGVELGKLSVYHSLISNQDKIASTLLGVGRMEIMKINLDIVHHGLTDKERSVLDTVKQKYFSSIGNVTWDSGIWDLDVYNKSQGK